MTPYTCVSFYTYAVHDCVLFLLCWLEGDTEYQSLLPAQVLCPKVAYF